MLKLLNQYAPTEPIIVHQPIGLTDLGARFNALAPFKACRLCGAVYQSPLDLDQYELWVANTGFTIGFPFDPTTFRKYKRLELDARERRERWLMLHNRRKHNNALDMIRLEELHRDGKPFTPEAAHILSSYGIFSVGDSAIEDDEVVHAMGTAPRAPINDPDGL